MAVVSVAVGVGVVVVLAVVVRCVGVSGGDVIWRWAWRCGTANWGKGRVVRL